MMIDVSYPSSWRGQGKTDREVVLNEIQEARNELRQITAALATLEGILRSKLDDGQLLLTRRTTRLLTQDQMKPLLAWILSLYESFVTIYALNSNDRDRLFYQAEIE